MASRGPVSAPFGWSRDTKPDLSEVQAPENTKPEPYTEDVDERRVFEVDCQACGASATVLFEAGRTRPWEHDERTDATHNVDYWRVDR